MWWCWAPAMWPWMRPEPPCAWARTRVRIVYRRSSEEMPARTAEIHHAEEEGIEFYLLTAPTRFLGNEKGRLTGMECLRMELGEPDDSGRRETGADEGFRI